MTNSQASADDASAPVRTETLPSGVRRHFLANGAVYEEDGPRFQIEYQSLFPGKTYFRDVAVFGLAERPHLFEAWCFTSNALRTYAFFKVAAIKDLKTGKRITGEEMRVLMGGAAIEQRDG